jgi:hypothetical protein
MAKRIIWFGILIMVLAFELIIIGCGGEDDTDSGKLYSEVCNNQSGTGPWISLGASLTWNQLCGMYQNTQYQTVSYNEPLIICTSTINGDKYYFLFR